MFYESLVVKAMSPMDRGCLKISLPSGKELQFGSPEASLQAQMRVVNKDFFRKCALFGDIGFGEAYVDGDWETDDITKVISWMILNVETHPTLMDLKPKRAPINFFKIVNNLRHHFSANTVAGSRKNIAAHYDLGNEFFRLFLDPGMTYSSAYFKSSDDTLESAQANKFERFCKKLAISETDHVLEIGCGWGGFAVHAAKNYGCKVTAVTVSAQQHQYTTDRVRGEGLSGQVEVKLIDYRQLTGNFDKIVSIEMIEAVGHKFLDVYFQQCHRLLKPEGLLGIQAILAPDTRYESFRKNSDWIQKHIFPGGLLPSYEAIHKSIRKTGALGLLDYEDITPSYVRTLAAWRDALNLEKENLFALGFDEKFLKKWNYYFSYCEGAFAMKNIGVAQMVFTRPNNHGWR